jgi:two-component system sensor histidine kinase UhpB
MPQSPIKILLIEDSLTDAMLLQEHLSAVEFEKFEINHVQRLDEALALLRTEHFNVALIDLTLPDSTGPDTFARIQREAPLLPLVILTGLGDEMLAVEAVRRGVQDYLIKGQSDARQIVRAIRYAIERSRAEEAMRESESRFRLASDASRALVYDVDLVTRRAKSVYGLSRLLGYDPDEPNQNMEWWFRQVHPDDLYVTEKLIRGLAEGRSHVVQYRVRHKDGHYIAVEDSGSVVTNQHGQAVRVV